MTDARWGTLENAREFIGKLHADMASKPIPRIVQRVQLEMDGWKIPEGMKDDLHQWASLELGDAAKRGELRMVLGKWSRKLTA